MVCTASSEPPEQHLAKCRKKWKTSWLRIPRSNSELTLLKRYCIEMPTLTPPRAPSPCSISSVVDHGQDVVSLPGTEDDNGTANTTGSDPRMLIGLGDRHQKECGSSYGIECHISATKHQPDLQNRTDPIEEPKPVWTKDRKRAFRCFLFIHFVPVATTLVLFWLYLKGFQWMASDVQLKTLLFAAKLRKYKFSHSTFSHHSGLEEFKLRHSRLHSI